MAKAQMQQEIQKRVLKVTREQEEILREQTEVELSLSEDELKKYLEEVLQEVKKFHDSNKQH
jgi:hypothetical protein